MQYSPEYHDIMPTHSNATHPRTPLPSGVPRPAKFIRLDAELRKDHDNITLTVRSWTRAHELLVSRQSYYGQLYRASRDPAIREQYHKMCRMRVESRQAWDQYHRRLLDVEHAQQRHIEWRDQLQKWSLEQNRAANTVMYNARTRNMRRLTVAEVERYRRKHMPKLLARMEAITEAAAPLADSSQPAEEDIGEAEGEKSPKNISIPEESSSSSSSSGDIPPTKSNPNSCREITLRQLCMEIVNDELRDK